MNTERSIDALEEAIALKIAMHLERNIVKHHQDTLMAKRLSEMSNHIQVEYLKTVDSY